MENKKVKSIDDFRIEMNDLLDQGKYEQAKQNALNEIEKVIITDETNCYILAEAAGFLIDIGSENLDEEAARIGLDILKDNESEFEAILTKQSYDYCLANGMNALFRIENIKVERLTLERLKPHLTSAKNHYYKAFKKINLNELTNLDLEILTNLGNNLVQAGRLVEAVKLFKSVLRSQIKVPQALIGYADSLHKLIHVSNCPESVSLYVEIYVSYSKGLASGIFLPLYKKLIESRLDYYTKLLKELKFDFSTIERELEINETEYLGLSAFRKFCIENFLVLNEHSLFCKCSEVAKDNLSIVHSKITVSGNKVGRMELLLNRLKSEFNLARKLFYEGVTLKHDNNEVLYSELMDGEEIGESTEKNRASFRLCFGIFDKIAHGICYFFDLANRDKPFYFDSFWEEQARWETLKDMTNPHVIALYSIANDLKGSMKEPGEFGFYKHWRNKLEHRNMILLTNDGGIDFIDLLDDEKFITKEPFWFFKEQALHLLQICCAAIYSYTYAMRIESLYKDNNEQGFPFVIQPKIYR